MTYEEFKDMVKEGVWLIDIYGEHCAPCKKMEPIIDELKNELVGVNVIKLAATECCEILPHLRIMSVPTFLVFKNGELTDTLCGMQTKHTLTNSVSYARNH